MPLRNQSTTVRLRGAWAMGSVVLLAAALSACTTAPRTPSPGGEGTPVINVVAAENFWGSLAEQLGGPHVHVLSIINNPDADPHDYEPTAADARAMAGSRLAIINGIGYDGWAGKLVDANPSSGRAVLNVGDLVGVADGGNPHRWYSPPNVRRVIDQITADYRSIDPADAGYFDSQHARVVNTDLRRYFGLVDEIRAGYAGTPVGASESIVAPLAEATGLNLVTPASFLSAISEGSEPAAVDKAIIDNQITSKKIKVYIYNSQNATPDVQAQIAAAKSAGIVVTTVTETLAPAGASFQDWQVRQLTALKQALAYATGK